MNPVTAGLCGPAVSICTIHVLRYPSPYPTPDKAVLREFLAYYIHPVPSQWDLDHICGIFLSIGRILLSQNGLFTI